MTSIKTRNDKHRPTDHGLTANGKVKGQFQSKQSPLAKLAFQVDIAPHGAGQNAGGRQSQAMAAAGHAGIGVCLFVTLKNQLVVGLFDAGAVVTHRQGEKIMPAGQVNQHHASPVGYRVLE